MKNQKSKKRKGLSLLLSDMYILAKVLAVTTLLLCLFCSVFILASRLSPSESDIIINSHRVTESVKAVLITLILGSGGSLILDYAAKNDR